MGKNNYIRTRQQNKQDTRRMQDKDTTTVRSAEIEEVTEATAALAADIDALIGQLSSTPHKFTIDTLRSIVGEEHTHLYVATVDNQTAGMATVAFYTSPTGRKAWIEDVVVDSRFRGMKIGKQLVDYAIRCAKDYGPCSIALTSRPSRIAANALYRSSGFLTKETNVYKMNIKESATHS